MPEPIRNTQVFQFIEFLTLEDLQDIVKDIYVLPVNNPMESIHAAIKAKMNILEYVGQDYVQLAYWTKTLGDVPPPNPDTESKDE